VRAVLVTPPAAMLAISLVLAQGVATQAIAQANGMSREADAPRASMGEGTKKDAFGSKNWKPAPPVKKTVRVRPQMPATEAVAAPPPPSPPPLPFTYLGRMVDGGVTTVFLATAQGNLMAKAGDVIQNQYRLEQVTDTSLTLIYLPLNAQQQMSLGAPR